MSNCTLLHQPQWARAIDHTACAQTHPVLYMHEMTGPSKAWSGFTAIPYFEIESVGRLSAPVHLVHPARARVGAASEQGTRGAAMGVHCMRRSVKLREKHGATRVTVPVNMSRAIEKATAGKKSVIPMHLAHLPW